MGRSPCCDKVGVKRGPWTAEEDQKLLAYIDLHGYGSWRALPSKAGLRRCGKSCRLRWINYLRPGIKRGNFSLQEEHTTIQLHALLGNRWSTIANHLPRRTDNEIKNYWNTHLKKRLTKMGIDPVTHKPKNNALGSALSHMAQWESARLEAEARLVRESKLLVSNPYYQSQLGSFASAQLLNKATAPPPPPMSQPLLHLDILKAWQSGWPKSSTHRDSLVSPTSTLNLPENTLFPILIVEPQNDQWKCLNNNYDHEHKGDIVNPPLMEFQEMAYPTDNAWISSDNTNTLLIPSFMESSTVHHDLLYNNYDSYNNSLWAAFSS